MSDKKLQILKMSIKNCKRDCLNTITVIYFADNTSDIVNLVSESNSLSSENIKLEMIRILQDN